MKNIKAWIAANEDIGILGLGLALALALRLLLRDYLSQDADHFYLPWFDFMRNNGGFASLKFPFSNYSPLNLYFLLGSIFLKDTFGVSRLLAIKLIGIGFDFVGAYFVIKLINLKFRQRIIGYLGGLMFLFLPTVIINSGMWGQTDSTYTTFLFATAYGLLRKRPSLALAAFGLALAFKLQAVFLAPFLLLICILNELPFKSLLMTPAALFATLLPAWAAGRPLGDLLMVYFGQMDNFSYLNMNAPTFYALLDQAVYAEFSLAGIVLAAGVLLIVIAALYKLRPVITADMLLSLAALSLLITPYILPKMHERYFYPAEGFSLILAFYRPRTVLAPVILQAVALCTYHTYFFSQTIVPLPILAFVMLAPIGIVLYDFYRQLKTERQAA